MSGNLEDFLARAAKLRAQKADLQRDEQVQSNAQRDYQEIQSQYSDRRRERVVLLTDDYDDYDDEVVEAKIVDDAIADEPASNSSWSADRNKNRSGKSQVLDNLPSESLPRSGLSSLELVEMLRRPGAPGS